MSALIIPALAIGGVYLIYEGLTKKNRSSNSSSSSSSRKHKISSSTKKNRKIPSILIKDNETRKNKPKKENSPRQVNVLYSYGSVKDKKWNYTGLPSGWRLKKKRSVNDSKYSREAIFKGPRKTIDEMKQYLKRSFEYLKQKHIVKYYEVDQDSNI